ncbi:putative peptidoglycan-binding domain-containing protein [Luteimonas sp. J16]|uniref:peptidoglycan-binding protein n=1 Tax=unclassified Luteimonas TaxID=2629088 RepID=UPI000A078AD7|nr:MULTISPECIES: peptidoglycan-binding protein [unclassified Luteimonas]TWG90488.1 putative peptidoglycan-binding domain-containing protein [Luteimonas sp. J16]
MSRGGGHEHRVLQLGEPDRHGRQANVPVTGLESLVTHHPKSNRHAAMVDGVIVGVESRTKRSYAFVAGKFQEIETRRTDEYGALGPDQVLLIKDFIIETRRTGEAGWTRQLDVPAPVSGTVSRRDDRNGLVEISNDVGEVVVRMRHLSAIRVEAGDDVVYGQALGTQDNRGLGLPAGRAVHVHIEVDTRYYAQFERYMADLVDGQLLDGATARAGASDHAAAHDGTFRLGESHPRIAGLQRVMHGEGYRAADGGPLDRDGVYRPSMQGALLDFQRAHGVPQTGDIDPATLRFAPGPRRRDRDLADRFEPGRPMPREAAPATAPGHPDHPDHRGLLPPEADPPVNRKGTAPATGGLLDRVLPALEQRDPDAITRALSDLARSDGMQAWLERGRMALDLQQPPAADSAHARTPEPLFRG